MPILSNPKWELFAQALAKGKTGDAAYVAAGYKQNKDNASRLKANESILARVEELLGKAANRVVVTLEGQTENLKRIAARAEAIDTPASLAVARAAQMDISNLNGLVIDRKDVTVRHEEQDSSEILRGIYEDAKDLGIPIGQIGLTH